MANTTIYASSDDGDVKDGSGSWDGQGDVANSSGSTFRVGDEYVVADEKWRYRGFLDFDISSIPGDQIITLATLYVYYNSSQGDDVAGAAPDSADVGHVIVDHIEDYGALDAADYEAVAKTANIGTIVGDDIAPAGWYNLTVTSYVRTDYNEQDTPDTSCFRLRQSYEESYANCGEDNYWNFDAEDASENTAYLYIEYDASSSSSSSSSFSSSSLSSFSSSSSSSSSSFSSSSSSSSSFSSSSSSSSFSSSSSSSSSFSSSSFSSSSSSSSFSSSSSSSSSLSSFSSSSSSSSFSSSSSSSSFSSSSFSSSSYSSHSISSSSSSSSSSFSSSSSSSSFSSSSSSSSSSFSSSSYSSHSISSSSSSSSSSFSSSSSSSFSSFSSSSSSSSSSFSSSSYSSHSISSSSSSSSFSSSSSSSSSFSSSSYSSHSVSSSSSSSSSSSWSSPSSFSSSSSSSSFSSSSWSSPSSFSSSSYSSFSSSSSSTSFSSSSSTSFSSSSSSSMSGPGPPSSSSSSADLRPGDDQFDWSAVPDWFWWGPRATMKFDIRSGSTPEPTVDHSITLTGDSTDGSTYDGNAAWNGLGDFVNTGDVNTVVGEIYVGAGNKWRTRAHYKFDVSAIPDNAAINHATLYLYFSGSYGNGALNAAPDSSRVGRVTIDHMADWGAVLPASEFQEAARLENIDILIGNDKTPDGGRWVAVNVTTYIQEDVSVQHTPDTSCFRFRQTRELDYATCSSSNLWMLASANDATHQPYIVVNYFVEGEDWVDWEEAFDNKMFDHTLYRYVQQRFYVWVPHDVRESRDRKKLPQFIYRHFVLKWWGKRFRYEYRYREEFFPFGLTHIWGYTPIIWGQYRFANDSVISPTLYDELPVFEV